MFDFTFPLQLKGTCLPQKKWVFPGKSKALTSRAVENRPSRYLTACPGISYMFLCVSQWILPCFQGPVLCSLQLWANFAPGWWEKRVEEVIQWHNCIFWASFIPFPIGSCHARDYTQRKHAKIAICRSQHNRSFHSWFFEFQTLRHGFAQCPSKNMGSSSTMSEDHVWTWDVCLAPTQQTTIQTCDRCLGMINVMEAFHISQTNLAKAIVLPTLSQVPCPLSCPALQTSR